MCSIPREKPRGTGAARPLQAQSQVRQPFAMMSSRSLQECDGCVPVNVELRCAFQADGAQGEQNAVEQRRSACDVTAQQHQMMLAYPLEAVMPWSDAYAKRPQATGM